jgi:hypothetical protein
MITLKNKNKRLPQRVAVVFWGVKSKDKGVKTIERL